ncbi:hypothetical protein SIID45300_02136 [Candidatus Magnetaquicoccaceae bacterium FCR-1]|uniref:DUF423 domain-containing protein n=1 Tax=Candidatus Magnetaquiglobus chichijimensis TaxID=3141448 RepID=A0ABQ0CA85_9PROT
MSFQNHDQSPHVACAAGDGVNAAGDGMGAAGDGMSAAGDGMGAAGDGMSAAGRLIFLGSLNALLAVALGAFGKHALMASLSQAAMETWRTGAYYHLIHGVGLVLAGVVAERAPQPRRAIRAGWLLMAGIAIFSGSLYLLALTQIRVLGALTPLGGFCFLSGWLFLAWSVKPRRG